MIFYDKNGKQYDYNVLKDNYFDRGTTAKIYRINNTECLKVMNKNPENYFNEELFDMIKSLSLRGFVTLGTSFYQDGKIKAYTMEYLEKSKKSILDMPTDYTLENLHRLYKDILILTKNLIIVRDLYHRNIVIGDTKMTIIDFDKYQQLTFDDDILYQNVNSLLYAFKRHYTEALKSKGINLDTKMIMKMPAGRYVNYLFNYFDYKEEPAKILEHKLIGTRTPMELFDRKW